KTNDAAGAEAADNHRVTFLVQVTERRFSAAVPVAPAGFRYVLLRSAVPRKLRTPDRMPCLAQSRRNEAHLGGSSAQSLHQPNADPTACRARIAIFGRAIGTSSQCRGSNICRHASHPSVGYRQYE